MSNNPDDFQLKQNEIIIGLVGAVGTDLDEISRKFKSQFETAGYEFLEVKISDQVIINDFYDGFEEKYPFDRTMRLMDFGNEIREKFGDKVLAYGAASKISKMRVDTNGNSDPAPLAKTAIIIKSLKRPEEVEALRNIYREGFFLVGIYSDEGSRKNNLIRKNMSEEQSKTLIDRDMSEKNVKHGQRLEKTFQLSDFFLYENESRNQLEASIQRIVELIFGHPFHTPTFDEYAMFSAFTAALQSADLSRQVGAVIAKDEMVFATGANDCPKFGGGQYWPEYDAKTSRILDVKYGRDYTRGYDSNVKEQQNIIDKYIKISEKIGLKSDDIVNLLNDSDSPLKDLTEYGRVVHAEMAAISNAARLGISVAGATLYCTTFPCHNCAKHIIYSGIKRVVYVEPYEKSKAKDFHDDSAHFGISQNIVDKVVFEPFMGVGPRRFFDLFSLNLSVGYDKKRKHLNGDAIKIDLQNLQLRIGLTSSNYLYHESQATFIYLNHLDKNKG